MSEKLVSCIMPTMAGREAFLVRACINFERQLYPKKELLIAFDGEDVPEAIVELQRDFNVSAFPSRGRRLGDKRNFLVTLAHGEYVAHWDDDDWSHPDRLYHQVEAIRNAGRAVTAFRSILYWDEVNATAWRFASEHDMTGVGSSLVYRRSWALRHPFPAETLGEDTAFMRDAQSLGAISTTDGTRLMVAVNHAGCTCKRNISACRQWRPIEKKQLPAEFWYYSTIRRENIPA